MAEKHDTAAHIAAGGLGLYAEGCAACQLTGGTPGWELGRWWRVLAPDGSLWCETSDEDEARDSMRPGDELQREWRHTVHEWRPVRPALRRVDAAVQGPEARD